MAGAPDSVILEQPAAIEEFTAAVPSAGKGFASVDLLGDRLRTGSRRTASQGCVPAPLADLITEVSHAATRSGAARVSVVVMAEAAATSFKPAAKRITTEKAYDYQN